MKKIILTIFIITPLVFVAQGIKKEKVKTSFLSYPKIDVEKIDVNTLQIDFCNGALKYMSKSTKKTTNACKVKGASIKTTKAIDVFYYNFTVLSPVSYLKISDTNGNIKFIEKVTEGGKSFVDFGKNKCYWAEPVLESAYKKDKGTFETNSQKESNKNAMGMAKNFVNSSLFFTYIPQEFSVFYVKSKDFGYDDIKKAATIAAEGYDEIKDNIENKDAHSKLKQAISIWEKALEESTPDDKKSRINKKVTLHLAENIGTAYFYLMDFDKAQKVITDALNLEKNITNNGTIRRKALLANIRSYKKGYELNKNAPINYDIVKIKINNHPTSEIVKFKEEYKEHGNAQLVSDIKASKEEHDKGVASGEINPYQQYVVVAAGGDILTLPNLAAKLMKDPAGDKLDQFPEAVTDLDIVTLILRGNNLESIPPSIGKMTKLKKLVLTNNKLTSLPDEIGELKNLKTLNIKGNNISVADVSKIQTLLPDCKIKQ